MLRGRPPLPRRPRVRAPRRPLWRQAGACPGAHPAGCPGRPGPGRRPPSRSRAAGPARLAGPRTARAPGAAAHCVSAQRDWTTGSAGAALGGCKASGGAAPRVHPRVARPGCPAAPFLPFHAHLAEAEGQHQLVCQLLADCMGKQSKHGLHLAAAGAGGRLGHRGSSCRRAQASGLRSGQGGMVGGSGGAHGLALLHRPATLSCWPRAADPSQAHLLPIGSTLCRLLRLVLGSAAGLATVAQQHRRHQSSDVWQALVEGAALLVFKYLPSRKQAMQKCVKCVGGAARFGAEAAPAAAGRPPREARRPHQAAASCPAWRSVRRPAPAAPAASPRRRRPHRQRASRPPCPAQAAGGPGPQPGRRRRAAATRTRGAGPRTQQPDPPGGRPCIGWKGAAEAGCLWRAIFTATPSFHGTAFLVFRPSTGRDGAGTGAGPPACQQGPRPEPLASVQRRASASAHLLLSTRSLSRSREPSAS